MSLYFYIMERINSPSFFIGKGNDELISFGSGQPDLPPPDDVYAILPTYADFKYGPVQGLEKLRVALSKNYPNATPEQFIITNGASEALDLALRSIAKPGAKVLLPKPYYYSYPFNVKFAGMEPVFYELEDGKINYEKFENLAKDCLAVIINSPSNPTGCVLEVENLKKIEKLSEKLGFYIISDEVYKDLIYVRENYLIEGEKVITINSFSKTYAMCGFRVGYAYAIDHKVIEKMVEMKTHTSMNTNILGQEMAYEATQVPDQYVKEHLKIWKERKDIIFNGLKELGLDLWNPEGAFYVFPKMKNPNKVVNDLYYKYKMITYDGTWFGDPERVRFSYALDKEKIAEGLKRLKEYLGKEYKEN